MKIKHFTSRYSTHRILLQHQYSLIVQIINKSGNLIYSAPTSGGKTLVAELLMLRKIGLSPQGTIFFIVPFVALAEEKAEYLRTVWGDMFIGVRAFHGDDGGQNYTEDISVAVCTIER